MNRKWSEEEINILKENMQYKEYTLEEMGQQLNRSRSSVHNKIQQLKLSLRDDFLDVCENVVKGMIEGDSKQSLCQKYDTIGKCFNIAIRKYPEMVHKYNEELIKNNETRFFCYL